MPVGGRTIAENPGVEPPPRGVTASVEQLRRVVTAVPHPAVMPTAAESPPAVISAAAAEPPRTIMPAAAEAPPSVTAAADASFTLTASEPPPAVMSAAAEPPPAVILAAAEGLLAVTAAPAAAVTPTAAEPPPAVMSAPMSSSLTRSMSYGPPIIGDAGGSTMMYPLRRRKPSIVMPATTLATLLKRRLGLFLNRLFEEPTVVLAGVIVMAVARGHGRGVAMGDGGDG